MTFPSAGSRVRVTGGDGDPEAGAGRIRRALRCFHAAPDAGTVAACAAVAGVPDDRVVDVILAVHELAANAVTHGAGAGRLPDARDSRRLALPGQRCPGPARGPGQCGRGTACGSCARSPTRSPRRMARTAPRSPLRSDGGPGRVLATWVHKRPNPGSPQDLPGHFPG